MSKSEKIWTIWKKGKLNIEKIWKKIKMNSENILKIWKKSKLKRGKDSENTEEK